MNVINFRFLFLMLFLVSLGSPKLSAQLRVLSATGTIASFNEPTSGIDQTLIGGTFSIEYPIKSITLRGDVTYAKSNSDDSSAPPTIDRFVGYRGYLGYIIGNGNRIQFPVLIGLGLFGTDGDIVYERIGFSGHAGLRYYISSLLAVEGNVKYDLLQDSDDQSPGIFQLNIGLVYSYGL